MYFAIIILVKYDRVLRFQWSIQGSPAQGVKMATEEAMLHHSHLHQNHGIFIHVEYKS